MDSISFIVVVGVAVALLFDVINGFHDAANSIATIVSTRVLSPRLAVLWAAFFNFVAMFVFAPNVADTLSKIVKVKADDPAYVYVVLAGLSGAIIWDLITWYWGCRPALPTRSWGGSRAPASPTPVGTHCATTSSWRRWSHRRLTGSRVRPRRVADDRGRLDLQAVEPGSGRCAVPPWTVVLRVALFSRPRR